MMATLKRGFTDFENLPLMLNVNDIAIFMRISRAGAYNLVNSTGFPKITVGKRVLIPKKQLMDWLNQQQNKQYTNRNTNGGIKRWQKKEQTERAVSESGLTVGGKPSTRKIIKPKVSMLKHKEKFAKS